MPLGQAVIYERVAATQAPQVDLSAIEERAIVGDGLPSDRRVTFWSRLISNDMAQRACSATCASPWSDGPAATVDAVEDREQARAPALAPESEIGVDRSL